MRAKSSLMIVIIFFCSFTSQITDGDFESRKSAYSSPSDHYHDYLAAEIYAELASTGQSNIVSIDGDGNSFIACGQFNGTISSYGVSSFSGFDLFIAHGAGSTNLQVFTVEVEGNAECSRVAAHGDNRSTIVGWFDGTLRYGNTTIESLGKAGFALQMNHTNGEILHHYVLDSDILDWNDYIYGIDILEGGGVVMAGSSKGNLTNQSQGKNNATCSQICAVIAVLNDNLTVQEFTFVSGNKGVVAKDVAQHTITNSLIIVGNFLEDLQFDGASIFPPSSNGKSDIFVAEYVIGQGWTNSITVGGAGTDVPHSITKVGSNHFISAHVTHQTTPLNVSSGQSISSTVGGKDILLLEVDSSANYLSHRIIGSTGDDYPGDLTFVDSSFVAVTGVMGGELLVDNNTIGQNGQNNLLLAKIDKSGQGNDKFFISNGSGSSDGRGNGITGIGNNSLILGGRLAPGTTYIDGSNVGGTTETGVILMVFEDTDNDGIAQPIDNCPHIYNPLQNNHEGDSLGDLCDDDIDNDGIENANDNCPMGETYWSSTVENDWDQDGCKDDEAGETDIDNDGITNAHDDCMRGTTGNEIHDLANDRDADGCFDNEDNDDDGDNILDHSDQCTGPTSVVKTGDWVDLDNDGCHDTKPGQYGEDMNDDNDGFDDPVDDCPNLLGDSTKGKSGCPDSDGDSWANDVDDCPGIWGTSQINRRGCLDVDGDGYSNSDEGYTVADGADAFPEDYTQWRDVDMDGFGDNRDGFQADDCLNVGGSSFFDRFGCPDSDGDGYSDPSVDWDFDDGADRFANEPSQWADSDNDGYGDNPAGVEWDECPNEFGNSTVDRFGCIDTDGDGHSDGGADAFPNDKSQHMDVDGDGFGDNENGSNGDACPNLHGSSMHDRRGCYDSDGDGFSNPDDDWGLLEGADFFPADETQWGDYDGDGFGDNSSGNKGDACPIVHGLSMDDRFGCPDTDADGLSDPDSNWTTDDGADLCPDDAGDACLAYIMKHPGDVVNKHGGFIFPTIIVVLVIFRTWRQRQLEISSDEAVDFTTSDNDYV